MLTYCLNDSKGREVGYGTVESEALTKIKYEICIEGALEPFASPLTTKAYLICDASEVGMGAVLEKKTIGKSSAERSPIFYRSSSFRGYERNYSINEKEALVCVSAMNKFRLYLLGRDFVLRTEH